MKKLGKITINPEKVINNDELVNLRGGTYESDCRDTGLLAFQCQCKYPAEGLWRGCYQDQSAADDSLVEWCWNNTGECEQLYGI